MRRIGIILLFVVAAMGGYSQKDKKVNIDLGLMQNHQGFLKLFDGVVDVGANYNVEILPNFYGGVDFHIGFLNRKNTSSRSQVYKPGFILNYVIHLSKNLALIPQGRIGYTLLNLSNSEYNYGEMQSGWSPGGEIRFLWKQEHTLNFYVFGRFDYIYLSKDESFTKLEYYRNVYLTSFGLGVQINSGKK